MFRNFVTRMRYVMCFRLLSGHNPDGRHGASKLYHSVITTQSWLSLKHFFRATVILEISGWLCCSSSVFLVSSGCTTRCHTTESRGRLHRSPCLQGLWSTKQSNREPPQLAEVLWVQVWHTNFHAHPCFRPRTTCLEAWQKLNLPTRWSMTPTTQLPTQLTQWKGVTAGSRQGQPHRGSSSSRTRSQE